MLYEGFQSEDVDTIGDGLDIVAIDDKVLPCFVEFPDMGNLSIDEVVDISPSNEAVDPEQNIMPYYTRTVNEYTAQRFSLPYCRLRLRRTIRKSHGDCWSMVAANVAFCDCRGESWREVICWCRSSMVVNCFGDIVNDVCRTCRAVVRNSCCVCDSTEIGTEGCIHSFNHGYIYHWNQAVSQFNRTELVRDGR